MTPPILVPVTAEDDARRKRRHIAFWVTALAAITLVGGLVHKRSTSPLHAQKSFDGGKRLLRITRYEEAILSFDRAIALKPDFAEAYFLRGKALLAKGDERVNSDRAIEDFTKVIELQPGDPRPLLERCGVHLGHANLEAAIADCTKALALDPQLERAYNLRGAAIRATGDLRRALADFSRAVDLAPTPDNYYQRAATYELLGEYRPALADLDLMVATSPGSPQAYSARAEARLVLGDIEGVKRDRQRAEELFPPPDRVLNNLRTSLGVSH